MEHTLREIQDLRRKGASVFEVCEFVLNSEKHRNAWFNAYHLEKKGKLAWEKMLHALFDFRGKEHYDNETYLGKITSEALIQDLVEYFKLRNTLSNVSADDLAWILGELGKKGKAAIPELMVALSDNNPQIREKAAQALGKMGSEAKIAAPDLISTLWDDFYEVHAEASNALLKIGEETIGLIDPLTEALQDPDYEIRAKSAEILGRLGEKAKGAIPQLLRSLQDDFIVRSYAFTALVLICKNTTEAMPYLIKALKNSEAEIRLQTAKLLGELGTSAKEAIPFLLETRQDKIYHIRAEALFSLIKMGQRTSNSVAELIEILQNEDLEFRAKAAESLGIIGKEAIIAVPVLVEALEDEDSEVRTQARVALNKISENPPIKPITKDI